MPNFLKQLPLLGPEFLCWFLVVCFWGAMQGRYGRGWGSEGGVGLLFILAGCFSFFFFFPRKYLTTLKKFCFSGLYTQI